jgi:hypothetical protein
MKCVHGDVRYGCTGAATIFIGKIGLHQFEKCVPIFDPAKTTCSIHHKSEDFLHHVDSIQREHVEQAKVVYLPIYFKQPLYPLNQQFCKMRKEMQKLEQITMLAQLPGTHPLYVLIST